jgi:hypothetical protein
MGQREAVTTRSEWVKVAMRQREAVTTRSEWVKVARGLRRYARIANEISGVVDEEWPVLLEHAEYAR